MTEQKKFPQMDWQQVALNGGPPCFFVEGPQFCGRAESWPGHGNSASHDYVSLEQYVQGLTEAQPAEDERVKEIVALVEQNTGPKLGYTHKLCEAIRYLLGLLLDSAIPEAKSTKTYKEENGFTEQARQLVSELSNACYPTWEPWVAAIASFAAEAATQGQAAIVQEINNCEKCDLCEDHLP